MFKNRFEAGLLLADKLNQFANEDSIVLAIPRGGVPVGYAVAQKIKAPLEVILAKKLGIQTTKNMLSAQLVCMIFL